MVAVTVRSYARGADGRATEEKDHVDERMGARDGHAGAARPPIQGAPFPFRAAEAGPYRAVGPPGAFRVPHIEGRAVPARIGVEDTSPVAIAEPARADVVGVHAWPGVVAEMALGPVQGLEDTTAVREGRLVAAAAREEDADHAAGRGP